MAQDFSRYLDVAVEDIPKNIASLPGGHFFADISGWKTTERDYDKATGGAKTPVVEITFKITSADSDVEFTEGGMVEGNEVGKTVNRDYTLNDPDRTGQTMIRKLAEDTCKLAVAGLHLSDVLDALKGQPVRVFNVPRPGQEEGQFFPKITKVLPAE